MRNIFAVLFFCYAISASADSFATARWNLPKKLSDQNTSIRFELDSTWHMVHGKVSGISGEVRLIDPVDPQSIVLEVLIPVASFDTDNSMRDSKMRRVLSADKYKHVYFRGDGLQGACTPALVTEQQKCSDSLRGTLRIMEISKSVSLPVEVSRTENDLFIIKGKLPIEWGAFGVEDPSIFVAAVDPIVTVFFESTL